MNVGARAAFDQRDWTEAYRLLTAEDRAGMDAADLERLAVAAYMVGDDESSRAAFEAAHIAHRSDDRHADAARCAAWLAITLLLRGEVAQGGGWLARTERIIEDQALDCAASGYLIVPAFVHALDRGDLASCRELAEAMRRTGRRFDDVDLIALGTLSEGQTALLAGDVTDGIALFDETMVGLHADEVSPIATGIVYCAVIEACMTVHELARAAEWTDALSAWCEDQPGLVPFRGQCAVHRSQILSHRGDWLRALAEARHAEELLTHPPHPALGLACYQTAELHRLRGEHDAAEAAYRAASGHGYSPEPGLALLHLARGQVDDATATINGAVHRDPGTASRPHVLAAAVEIHRTSGDITAARAAADELAALASDSTTPLLLALAGQANGAVSLAEGSPSEALVALRAAARRWAELGAPYEVARSRTLLGLALAALGDSVSADLELHAARATFAELGAAPDVARLDSLRRHDDQQSDVPLTAHEQEVLRAVADGRTNRKIAEDLTISEHTVARHLQNIFTKIDVRSRAAATAYAYEHRLV